ncbi:hypothetical protein OAO54_02285 [Amylibacter sp.]|nr:hypothetical protein [Amylibacter sp.]
MKNKKLIIITTNGVTDRLSSEFIKNHQGVYSEILKIRYQDAVKFFDFASLSYRSSLHFIYSLLRFYIYNLRFNKIDAILDDKDFDLVVPFLHYDLHNYLFNHRKRDLLYFVEEGDIAYIKNRNLSKSMKKRRKYKNRGFSSLIYKISCIKNILGSSEQYIQINTNNIKYIVSSILAFPDESLRNKIRYNLINEGSITTGKLLFLVDDMYRLAEVSKHELLHSVERKIKFTKRHFGTNFYVSLHPSIRSDTTLTNELNDLFAAHHIIVSYVVVDTLAWCDEFKPSTVIGTVSSVLRYAARNQEIKVYSDISLVRWHKSYFLTSEDLAKSYQKEGVNLLTEGQMKCVE